MKYKPGDKVVVDLKGTTDIDLDGHVVTIVDFDGMFYKVKMRDNITFCLLPHEIEPPEVNNDEI